MKYKYLMSLVAVLLWVTSAFGQNNTITIPDVSVAKGRTISLPVNMDNTADVVGVQFTLTVPQGLTIDASSATLSDRSDDHSVTFRSIGGNKYMAMVFSAKNKAIKGRTGKLLTVQLTASNSVEEDAEYPLVLSDVVMGARDGSDLTTGYKAGKVSIADTPILEVDNIQVSESVINPGSKLSVSWTVKNVGGFKTQGGWSEYLSLVSTDGKLQQSLGVVHYDGILNANSVVSRQTEVSIPFLLGIDGNVRLQVRVVPDTNIGESIQEYSENKKLSVGTILVNKFLDIDISPKAIDENSDKKIAIKISRSGRWIHSETFSISSVSSDSRVSIPNSIIIPEGQSGAIIYVSIADNNVLDNDSVVNVKVVGNSYPEQIASFIINDNEYPSLNITSSNRDLKEGDSFQLTITSNIVPEKPVTVTLTSEKPRRFTIPETVVIPAGETSVNVDVLAVDNEEIELDESISFRASAEKYDSGECIVMLKDNDMPSLSFSLTPNAVIESDGYSALLGVIKRTDNLDKRVTIKLSDDSNGLLTYSNQTIIMAKNQTEVQFSIGVTDNDIVDGNHTVNVCAAVYSSSCNCSVSGDSNGSMVATVNIIDDDGPTVKIKASGTVMLEGSENNIFIVSHNVQSNTDITVHVSSDNDDMLEYNHELIIPAGKQSAELSVKVKNNDSFDDNKVTAFTVEADGFALGTCWILVTDQTLPDAIVTLSTDKSAIEAEQTIILSATVKNVGNSNLRSTTSLEFAFSGAKEKGKVNIGKSVAPGDSVTIEYNYLIPAITGSYTFEATVNADAKVPELIYANNGSEKVKIEVLSPFTLSAKADKEIYVQNDSVHISGEASGIAGKNANVEVYIINEGVRQILNTVTNDNGYYSVSYKLLSKQCGHFVVGACYPGSKEMEAMDEFDVYGLTAKSKKGGYVFEKCEMSDGETYEGAIIISNPGNLAQSGISVTSKAESANCRFNFSVPNNIGAGESLEIPYSIQADSISGGSQYQEMPIIISTDNGAKLNYTLYYYVYPLKAKLQSNKTYISTTMTHGVPREYPITIKNIGRAETGKITLSLPSWIQTSTSNELASLAQGDSTTIVLRFMPTDAMKLNVRVSGRIGINCANGDGTSISFNLTPVSESKGTLKVDVVDEYTFFTNEAPHVNKAKVSIKNPSTNEIVAEGETTNEGTFVAELPEGYYSIAVDADKHDSYTNTVIVDPGSEKTEEVFLSYQAITYSWNVEETTVEDEYEIETIVKYETRVPKPVVIVTLPDEQPEPNSIIPVIVTNKGLVNAVDVNMSLSISNGYTLEFINDPTLEVLAPQQAHVFYAKMVPEGANKAKARMAKASGYSKCYTLIARAKYKELCKKYTGEELAEAIKKWGTRECLSSSSSSSSHGGGGGSYGPGSPSLWGNSGYGSYFKIEDTDVPSKFCDQVLNDKDNDDIVPDEDPEESNCEEKPTLNYKLVSNDGTRKIMKGVAADGVSQVRIVLGPNSAIPSSDCEFQCQWTLSEEMGSLENENSWNNVVYTAPEDFPVNKTGSSYTIHAKLSYSSGKIKGDTIVAIEIVRVPLVLLHGLHDTEQCWHDLKVQLEKSLYKPDQVLNESYKSTNCAHFKDNLYVASKRIDYIKDIYKKQGYVATKADLIGHSMGGILSRLHVQYVDDSNVHKLITVNTPHSGSPLGDLMQNNSKLSWLVEHTTWLLGFDTPAIYDLAENSNAIDELLNDSNRLDRMVGIPVHSVTTNAVNREEIFDDAFRKSLNLLYTPFASQYISLLVSANYLGLTPIIGEVRNMSDLVVPMESQKGGLTGSHTWNFDGDLELALHMNSPKTQYVWAHLINMLRASVDDNQFCKQGFRPVDLSYDAPHYAKRFSKNVAENVEGQWNLSAKILGDSVHVTLNEDVFHENKSIIINFSTGTFVSKENSFACKIPEKHTGKINILALLVDNDEILSDSIVLNTNKRPNGLISISPTQNLICNVSDKKELNVIGIWEDNTETFITPNEVYSPKHLVDFDGEYLIATNPGVDTLVIKYDDLSCNIPIVVYGLRDQSPEDDPDNSPSICSTVTLSFKQRNVMTRQAFRGTLTVNNGHETVAMQDVKLNLEVRDMNGNVATSHEFQIDAESIDGFAGNLDMESGWSLDGGKTGTATILFIPTKYAAPTEPKDYAFGGSFSYKDPYTGLVVTRDLNPVTLTVNPSPNLEMTYFMQRDVFGDDPLTEAVEPMKPSEFALIVNNKGYGDAENMKLTTRQPEIIDNQKGLAISFELISTQLNGQEKTMSLGGSMTSDFGNIPAQSQAYAQWWLQSSLLGHFIEYDIKATHLTSHDNPDLSLLDTVTIHELIHGFTVESTGEKPLRGFLVNDIKDREDLPDGIYFTDATHADAFIAAGANIVKKSDTEYILTVNASSLGWNYISILDPTNGKQALSRVVSSDGREVNIDNIWQTDRTLRDGKDPLYENRLHFVGNLSGNSEVFNLTFEPKPEVELEVESYSGVPEEGHVLKEQLTSITVKFNKPIQSESFTNEDITVTCQGVAQDVSVISVEQLNDTEYKMLLNDATLFDGYYVLTVQTAGITDNEGFNGSQGKQTSWIQLVDGKVALKVVASPMEGGSITPGSGRFDYNTNVTLTATPSEGYEFVGWSENNENISSDNELSYFLETDTELKALFTSKYFDVTIEYDAEQGSVLGGATGIFPYGEEIHLIAQPDSDYAFDGWIVNDELVSMESEFTITVNSEQKISATFKRLTYRQEIKLSSGWNWVSTYLNEPLAIEPIVNDLSNIVGQIAESIEDPEYGMVGDIYTIEPGHAYKLNVKQNMTFIYNGHLHDIQNNPIKLNTGWNWISYPYMEEKSINDVLPEVSEGDCITSQFGFSEYADGRWEGTLDVLTPGVGYIYKSVDDKTLEFDFSDKVSKARMFALGNYGDSSYGSDIDIRKYPSTMNIIGRVSANTYDVDNDACRISAFAGNECRGVSRIVGGNHYLTIYGDDETIITFVIEKTDGGSTYLARENVTFGQQILGSRKSPYMFTVTGTTDILNMSESSRKMSIYSIEGVLITPEGTPESLKKLSPGVYIVDGQKFMVK